MDPIRPEIQSSHQKDAQAVEPISVGQIQPATAVNQENKPAEAQIQSAPTPAQPAPQVESKPTETTTPAQALSPEVEAIRREIEQDPSAATLHRVIDSISSQNQ